MPRRVVHWRLDVIRHLRNRIAHHEPILTSRNQVYTGFAQQPFIALPDILECTRWISTPMATWLETKTRYGQAIAVLASVNQSGINL